MDSIPDKRRKEAKAIAISLNRINPRARTDFQLLLHRFITLVCGSDLLKWEVALECYIWSDHSFRFCQKFKVQTERFPSERRSYTL
ncbi:hypothetical protein L1987_39459 [Smallanthus sonchifolius]|uniref:Uncharacterized protein n=1 Tax=Smallanthus sonchifolius TaxID=185202 RepID=A0ACB9HM22_9ASTR|nr:hypothetical protein L1987_39459 [Smallanthus sonchifolius]